ncbi:MAG TPA: SBBP repeat-containing protein, partial [Desulfohalobiaceae bacterium]|nr:SBBP repeat-containing protein [Desulfohalobiaceae bacterium]
MEKVIKLDPHAEVENLQIKVNGANDLSLTKNEELKISTNTAPLIFTKPVAYQLIDRKRQYVHVTYCITEDGYSFRVGEYDKRHELIIDPLLTSAVVSGSDKDIAEAIATDCCGNVYIGAGSRSSDFPVTPGVFDRNLNGSTDALVLKFDSTLQKLISATFLGGSSLDYIYALDISDSGSVFVAGYTKSDDIPTNSNAYDRTFNGSSSDGFIAKLDSGLKEIQACTYLGGSNHWYDTIFALTVDDKGDVYVAGDTRASDFPVLARSHDNSYNGGETDGFIAKLDGNLSTLKASTFLGGSEADFIYCMQMDRAKENIYVAGKSTSPDLPATPGAFETI